MAIQDDVKANVLALLNAEDINLEGQTYIYGMWLKESMIEFATSINYNYIQELVGDTVLLKQENKNKMVAGITDMTMLRVYCSLAGISIPTHFNYKIGEHTVSKNVHPMIEMGITMYGDSVKRWIKLLLSGNWAVVSPQEDLTFISPIYDANYGHDNITMDTPNV